MRHPPIRLSLPSIRYVAISLDVLIIWCCGWLTCGTFPAQSSTLPRYMVLVLVASLLLIGFLSTLYRYWRVNELGAMLIILVWRFLSKSLSDISPVWFVGWGVGALVSIEFTGMASIWSGRR